MPDKNKTTSSVSVSEDGIKPFEGVSSADEEGINIAETVSAAKRINRTISTIPTIPQKEETPSKTPEEPSASTPVAPPATATPAPATSEKKKERRVLRKYILTSENKYVEGRMLHRIKAVRDFGDVKAGELGGWVESERNLSHEGLCWVYDKAEVRERAVVFEDAMLYDKAYASGDAKIYGNAKMYDCSEIYGKGRVYDNAKITGFSVVHGEAQVYDYGCLSDNSEIKDHARLHEDATVTGTSIIGGEVDVCGRSVIQRIVYGNRVFRDVDDFPARY